MLDRWCLVEAPNAPRHRAERDYAEADNETRPPLATTSTLRPAPVPGLRVQRAPSRRPVLYSYILPSPPPVGGENTAYKISTYKNKF